MDMEKDPKEELKELSPFLAQLKEKGEGFRVPEGYFDNLQDQVMEKIQETAGVSAPTGRKGVLRVLRGGFGQWAAAAAIALLALAGLWFLWPQSDLRAPELALSEISAEEASAYIDATLEDYELALLVEELDYATPVEEPLPHLDPEVEELLLQELEYEDLEGLF